MAAEIGSVRNPEKKIAMMLRMFIFAALCLPLAAQETPVPAFHPGAKIVIRIDDLKDEQAVSIRAQLVSKCDEDQKIESEASWRLRGKYYVRFTAPDEPCEYEVNSVQFWQEGDTCDQGWNGITFETTCAEHYRGLSDLVFRVIPE